MDVQELVRLVRDGASDREITALVGLNRRTVSRYRRWATEQRLLDGPPEEDFGEHWRGFLDEGFAPALDCLDLIARAVTPPGRPRRFNARFFMARADDATGEIRHSSEMGDIRWVRLDEARELPLPTITGLILGEIGRLVKEPPDATKQRKIPLFITVHRKHLMIEE